MNSVTSPGSRCPNVEQLQSFVNSNGADCEQGTLRLHLEECASCRDLVKSLRYTTIDVTRSLTDGKRLGAESTLDMAEARPLPDTTASPDRRLLVHRYRLGAEIARGGMGVVHRATDLLFQREVAVKLLLPRWEEDSDLVQQAQRQAQATEAFQYEAEITARLQHPGIPPVHELGRLENGLPFLAMKLIQGRTLQELLQSRSSLQEDLSRWLSIFEQIAQAVGYAHAQGILHRDLKPLNVMVGQFGEVQVMDWGLAKVIGRPEQPGWDEPETVANAETPGAPRHFVSRRGDIKGTLQYMSPEQARGEIDELDPRTDVFGLGGILCQVLTGLPPFAMQSKEELKQAAVAGAVESAVARIKSSAAAPEVVELAIQCLAADKSARPASGEIVAQAMASHRASVEQRLRQAETERALSQQRLVEQSRRRKLWYAVTAAIVVLVVGTAMAALMIADREVAAREAAVSRQAVSDFLQDQLLALAGADNQAEAGVAVDPDLKVRDLVLRAADRIEGRFPGQPRVEIEVRSTIGEALRKLGEFDKAIDQLSRAYKLGQETERADHPTVLMAANNLAATYCAAGKYAEALPLLESTLAAQRRVLGESHTDTLMTLGNLSLAYDGLGRSAEGLALKKRLLEQSREKLGPEQSATLQTQYNLAVSLLEAGQMKEALALHEQTLAQRQKVLPKDHPDVIYSMSGLANAYEATGRTGEAAELTSRALTLAQAKLGAGDPVTLSLSNKYGALLMAQGKLEEGIPYVESALKTQREKFGATNPDTLDSLNNLAYAYRRTGRAAEAVKMMEQILEAQRQTLGVQRRETLKTMSRLATQYSEIGNHAQAVALFDEHLRLCRQHLGPRDPETSFALHNLAGAMFMANRLKEAIPLMKEAWELRRDTLGPDDSATLASMTSLAAVYAQDNRAQEAIPLLEEGFRLMQQQAGATHPDTIRILLNLGMAEQSLARYEAAEGHLLAGYEASQKLESGLRQQVGRQAVEALAQLYQDWNKPEKAREWASKR